MFHKTVHISIKILHEFYFFIPNNRLMKSKIWTIITSMVLLLLIGCVSYYPQVVDIPLLQKKGDVKINAGYFLAPNLDDALNLGVHSTISGGVTDVLAVQAYSSIDIILRWHLQCALGLFKGFENNTVTELYGGWGFGTGGMWNVNMDFYNLYFAQFNLGKANVGNKNVDYGLGLKGGFVAIDYSKYNDFYSDKLFTDNSWIAEPSLFLRFGGKKLKMNIMVNYMWANNIPEIYYFPLSIGMGLNIKIGKKQEIASK